jgi:hypothetical protein
MRSTPFVLVVLVLGAVGTVALAGGEPKPKDSVVLAKSWQAALDEAKLIGAPIVVHNHGFYCGPCWGMHSAVMCNKEYIDFAKDNTVEVIALERLQEGVDKKEKNAETYKAKVNGAEVEYLVEFPGLTVADMLALASSKAGSFNHTGKVPYTCIVDPWTEEELKSFSGSTPKGDIEDAVLEIRKQFEKDHGKGVARRDVTLLAEAEADVEARASKGDYPGALGVLAKLSGKAKAWPQAMQERITAAHDEVVAAASDVLAKIEAAGAEDKARARSELSKIMGRLKGTGLEEKAKTLLDTLSSSS